MATNERVEVVSDDKEYYLQDAPAQSVRAYYTPGKITPATPNPSQTLEMNWPREFPIKVGVPAIDNAGGTDHVRTFLIGRNTVSDVKIAPPVVTGTTTETISYYGSHSGTHIRTNTKSIPNDGNQERQDGWDGLKI